MTRSVIINADDFGLSPGVNRGIVSAFREGVLTSTTMLVNLESFADAVRLARENPDLPVGIHLSLLWGRPVSGAGEIPALIGAGGEFPSNLSTVAARYFLGRLPPGQVELEFRSQIRAFLDTGLTPTHVDTHKHVHCLPGILDSLISAAREHGIDKVRLPVEDRPRLSPISDGQPAPRSSWQASAKRRLIRVLARGAGERLHRAGMRTADHFVGIEHTGSLNSDVLNLILSNLGRGTTEIMCHPGYSDDPALRYGSPTLRREVELAGLKHPSVRECIESRAIRLTHYGEI